MKTASADCFTYEQLSRFANDKMQSKERVLFLEHVQDCEMCNYALQGFQASPFSQDDLNEIEVRINQRTNSIYSGGLKYIFLGLVSVMAIAAFYSYAKSFDIGKVSGSNPKTVLLSPKEIPFEKQGVELRPPKKRLTGNSPKVHILQNERPENFTPESMEPIGSEIIPDPLAVPDYLPPVFSNNETFIHHLKVAAYHELYFRVGKTGTEVFHNHVPPLDENHRIRNSMREDAELSEPLVSILEKGLLYLSQEKYYSALTEFQRLLAESPKDINALFYSALAYSKVADYQLAIRAFNRVINHSDKTFSEEAKWNLALVYIAIDDTVKAKGLLEEIVAGKGFYAKDAQKKRADL